MKNYFLIILFYLLLSCNYNKNNILIQKTNKKIIHKIKKKKLDSLSPEQLIKLYGKSNSPDTLMPYKIYSTADSENLYGLINLYQTYDLNKEYFVGQIRKLFYFDKNIDNLLIKVEDNKLKIRKKTRDIILDSYNEFNSIEGEDFSYLCSIKDSFAIEITENMFKNEKSNKTELKIIAHWISESFNDSTFIKNLNKFKYKN